jgi:hypothetical protein
VNSILSINPQDPSPILAQVPSVIADFWKRLPAAIIDALLVGTVGFILGLIFFDPLMRLGDMTMPAESGPSPQSLPFPVY